MKRFLLGVFAYAVGTATVMVSTWNLLAHGHVVSIIPVLSGMGTMFLGALAMFGVKRL